MAQAKLADLLELKAPEGYTRDALKELQLAIEKLNPEYGNIYSSEGFKSSYYSFTNYSELKNFLFSLGFPENTPDKYYEPVIANWYDNATTTANPEYSESTIEQATEQPAATTVTEKTHEGIFRDQEEQRRKHEQSIKNQKEAVAKFKEVGEKRYQDQKKADVLKTKQSDELLGQFFAKVNGKVVVVATQDIPDAPLSKDQKTTLLTTERAAKEDPVTTKLVFAEKIRESIKNSGDEYKSIPYNTVDISAGHLVDTLRSLPDHKSISEIQDKPRALNTLSIIVPLSDANSPEMIKLFPSKEARELFAQQVQTYLLAAEANRIVNVAATRAVLGEEISLALHGSDAITNFKISDQPGDRDSGAEIDLKSVFEETRRVSDFIAKAKTASRTEEVVSTGFSYYSTYSSAGTVVSAKTASLLTKALPLVGAAYGFRKGTLLAHWAQYNMPMLASGQNIAWLTAGGVKNTVLASGGLSSRMLFDKSIGKLSLRAMEFTKGSKILYTAGGAFGEKAFGIYIGQAAGKVGAGTVAVKAGGQLVVKAVPSAVMSKVGAFLGSAGGFVGIALGWIGGEILGKLINGPKLKKWFEENKWALGLGTAVGGTMLFGIGPGIVLGLGALALTGGLGSFAFGALNLLGVIGRSIGISIAVSTIITILVVGGLTAFIMLVINNGAYVVPPSLTTQSQDNLYIEVSKTGDPSGPFENSDLPIAVKYTITVKARRGPLTNISFDHTCKVLQEDRQGNCTAPIPEAPASISPSSPFVFEYEESYSGTARYNDSLILNVFSVTADSSESQGESTSGSETIIIGDPPTQCLEIEGDWGGYRSNIEAAIGYLTSEQSSYVAKVCAQYPEGLPLRYNSSANDNYWGWFQGSSISFYRLGVKNVNDAIYTLSHELVHALVDDSRSISIYLNYLAFPSILTEVPRCFYSYNAILLEERLADATAFAIMPNRSCSLTGQDSNINHWPRHKTFVENNILK